jgi:uncharacterized alkaline shock family protein YloU
MASNDPTTLGSGVDSGIRAGTGTGKTVIHDSVIAKIVGLAAREVTGVYALGGGTARALGAIRNAISSTDLSQGVSVEIGETQVAVDISLVAEYPLELQKVADDVRIAVISAIESLVGMQATEVNITVNDVHIPSDDDIDPTEARVQ